jgi:TolB-like protein/Tfp pilus assembly protein PilF
VLQSQPGKELTIPSRKGQALIAVLALAGGEPVPRERLMGLLWSDRGEQQARSSLRQVLSELRKVLADSDTPLLTTQRDSVCLDTAAIEIDAGRFEHLIDAATPEALVEATNLYRGDLLNGLDVRDPAFEGWLRIERERLRGRTGRALRCVLEQQTGDNAIATARRLLAFDPLQEPTHRVLMRLYADNGERTLALKQYQTCCDVLAADLGVVPEPKTEKLAQAIRTGAESATEDTGSDPGARATEPEALSLPDIPSIAVLPFTNLSTEPEQEYFADGIADDIITTLSKIPKLFIVARDSTFTYRGQSIDVKQVGREQGVRYVLEGSVRKTANRVRVTAQLIDATLGHHLWAERYDCILDDIFKVQDDITKKVTTELQVRLTEGEAARVWSKGTSNIEAWEKIIRAFPLTDHHVREHNAEARRLADEAVRLDPTYATAWVTLGWTHWEDALWGWSDSRESSMKAALSCAQRALKCDPENPEALVLLGCIYMEKKNAGKATELGKQAVALSPNNAGNVALAAMVMIFGGEPKNGLPLVKRAMRLSPVYPQWFYLMVGIVHHIVGDHHRALGVFRECVAKEPETTVHRIWLTSALVETGQGEEAEHLAAEILEIDPDFKTSRWLARLSADDHLVNRLSSNLVEAGLPS